MVNNAADQKQLPTTPDIRGPTFSTHSPNALVVTPKTTAAQEKTGSNSECVQSHGAAATTPVMHEWYNIQ